MLEIFCVAGAFHQIINNLLQTCESILVHFVPDVHLRSAKESFMCLKLEETILLLRNLAIFLLSKIEIGEGGEETPDKTALHIGDIHRFAVLLTDSFARHPVYIYSEMAGKESGNRWNKKAQRSKSRRSVRSWGSETLIKKWFNSIWMAR